MPNTDAHALYLLYAAGGIGLTVLGYLARNWMTTTLAKVDQATARAEDARERVTDLAKAQGFHVTREELERTLERIEGRQERALDQIRAQLDHVLMALRTHYLPPPPPAAPLPGWTPQSEG